jgi:hypothetical protein
MLATGLPILGHVFIANVVIAAMLFPFASNYMQKKHLEITPKKAVPEVIEPSEHPLGSLAISRRSRTDIIASIARCHNRNAT